MKATLVAMKAIALDLAALPVRVALYAYEKRHISCNCANRAWEFQ